ncbi:uncharacterized protein LOC128163345 [Crassostrea angulata]|uniref:uncharacterized protein LOC128163345 n=1 Tax=Magallana angulata TaxID=2784310 RepID=UPI0022B1245C|nr:uncharacterized protein LOC128163345 [Crassostrea angulata]
MEDSRAMSCPISPDNEDASEQKETIDAMGKLLEHDAEKRKSVLDIYDSVVSMFEMENFEKNLRKELATKYGDSTGCICQIFNSVEKRAIAIKEKGFPTTITEVTDKKLMEYVCVERFGQNRQSSCSKRVDIFWPIPMLKEHAIIIDTPGVGDSDEMTTTLLDYLTEAVAFIYVINTPNAGGVQDDRLGKILRKQRDLEEKGNLKQFDPGCAIFVCNKWDQVSEKEEQDVWLNIAEKLKAIWPTREDQNIEAQMFKMSVKTELERSEKGLECTEKLKSLISGMDRLVSACLERRVTKHIYWLQEFLNTVLVNVIANINASRKKQDEKNEMKKEVEKRLTFLKNRTETIKGDTAKISDVGTLKPKSQIRGTIIGTPSYCAPEAAAGQIYGLPADIFSLAIVMWEMWYGQKVRINVLKCTDSMPRNTSSDDNFIGWFRSARLHQVRPPTLVPFLHM